MQTAIVQFPGSNADWDALHALRDVLKCDAYYVFHKEASLRSPNGKAPDLVVLPGGFSYGDYLRPGAIAGFSPVVQALRAFASSGGPILGICNGFQILTELGLLPGALSRNAHLRFECRDVFLRAAARGVFTDTFAEGTVLRLPIAHADGRYECDAETLKRLKGDDRVAFYYCREDGSMGDEQYERPNETPSNPNGSTASIAGIYDASRRILGLMPHPERACEPILGGRDERHDGHRLFRCALEQLSGADS